MAKYDVTVPGRGKFRVTAPDDMPQADVLAEFERQMPAQQQTWGELAGDVATTVGRAAERLNPVGQVRQLLSGYTGLERQLLQGATLSGADELEAGAQALAGADYGTRVADIRRGNEAFARDNPVTAVAANVAGGVVPFLAGPGGAAASWASRGGLGTQMARGGALGGATGAVSGFGAGEGGLTERAPSAATGAGLGLGLGVVLPPVVSGAAHLWRAGSNALGRARQSVEPMPAGYEAPLTPRGRPIEGATFTADGAAPPQGPPPAEAFNAQHGALRMVIDTMVSAGRTPEEIQGVLARMQRSNIFHSSGEAVNAQTLAEAFPELQRLLRAMASSYKEVGNDVSQFLSARHTGILPRGASAADLAQRGIATRDRFMTGRTVKENEQAFGIPTADSSEIAGIPRGARHHLGTGQGNTSPAGALSRLRDATRRIFRVRADEHHGFSPTAARTSDDILEAMNEKSAPAYAKAFGVGDMVSVRPVLQVVAQRWQAEAAQHGKVYRGMVNDALDRFRSDDGQMVSTLRAFDKAKQKFDDKIEEAVRAGRRDDVRDLTRIKNDMIEAISGKEQPDGTIVGGITQGNLGQLYREARSIYSKGARDRDILERYKNAWKDEPEAVVAHYDTLDKDQQKLARYGIEWGLADENMGRRLGQDPSMMFDVRRAEEMLTLIGRRMRKGEADAEDVMRRFGDFVSGEQEMVRGTAKTAIGGSMTDRNVLDALNAGGLEIVQNVQSFANLWRGSQSLFDFGRGVMEMIINRAFGPSADRARELSRILLTANQQENARIVAQLIQMYPANRMARFNELMEQVRQNTSASMAGVAGAAGGIAGAPSPIASGGPVSF